MGLRRIQLLPFLVALIATGACRLDFHICEAGTHREAMLETRWCESESGAMQGLYTSWYFYGNEEKRVEGRFEAGQRQGRWRRWDDTGVLRREGSYEAGLRSGSWTWWHANGARWKRGSFREGQRDGDWSFWDRDGRVVEQIRYAQGAVTAIPVQAGDPRPNPSVPVLGMRQLSGIRWAFPIDCIPHSPIVVGSRVIATCGQIKLARLPKSSRVVSIDLRSGREIWRRDLPVRKVSSPSSDGELVYLTAGSELLGLDFDTGETRLRFALSDKVNEALSFSAPVRDETTLYFGSGRDDRIHALDLASNTEVWRYDLPAGQSPLVLHRGLLLVRIRAKRGLYAIHANSGTPRWTFRGKGGSRGAVAVADQVVYFGSSDEHLYAIDLERGRTRWKFKTDHWIGATPAVTEALVLVGSTDGYLYAVDRETGRERWRFMTGAMIEHAVRVAGDVVLLRGRDGQIYAIDAPSGKELWRFDTQQPWGSMAVPAPGAVVFSNSDGFLYALE